jgi:excisionase family DNA binding protein
MSTLVQLLTAKQVAALMGISVWYVDTLARTGELGSIKVGSRSRRYHPDDIAKFVERKRDGK